MAAAAVATVAAVAEAAAAASAAAASAVVVAAAPTVVAVVRRVGAVSEMPPPHRPPHTKPAMCSMGRSELDSLHSEPGIPAPRSISIIAYIQCYERLIGVVLFIDRWHCMRTLMMFLFIDHK